MLYAIVALLVLVVDQAVKYFCSTYIELNTGQRNLVPGILHLTNVHNTGAAFSFLEGARWFFVIMCLAFVAFVIVLMATGYIRGRAARWMAVLVIAGGLGNCIDRIISGYVVDMFEFSFTFFGWRFPVFNVADIFITLGIILFCILMLVQKDALGFEREPEEEKTPGTGGKTASRVRGRKEAASAAPRRKSPARENGAAPRVSPRKAVSEVDPGDPFAAWDSVDSRKATSRTSSAAKRIEESIHRQTGGEKTEYVMRTLASGKASEEDSTQSASPGAPAPEPSYVSPSTSLDEESYNLEDILAEFRDI